MDIIKKSSVGIQSLPLDAMLLSQRTIFLTEEITTNSATKILKQLLFLESEDNSEPIKLIINSPGGQVSAGLMLYDQLKSMTVPVDLYCVELAASMAAVILAGGKPGHRFILKHSKVMIHEPFITAGGVGGNASSVQKTAESILETKRTLVELLAQDTGRSVEEIQESLSYDNYMNAEGAIAFGICDGIVDRV